VNDAEEHVVLVDGEDVEVGAAPKLEAHRAGLLHRAFSVFLLDSQGRVLLQRRASSKYHSPGRWSNTCCGHPRSGESAEAGARRRLQEEMGLTCDLESAGWFIYKASVAPDLIEHELDHLFIGRFEGDPEPNAAEVSEWRWESPVQLAKDLAARPHRYSAWLAPALRALSGAGQIRLSPA
jgi:isopentenyl-diphosphate Delta-isomerase